MDKEPQQKQRFSAWDTVIAFLSLEILALVSFGLGGAFGMRIFDILGFFIGILTLGYAKNNFDKPTIKKKLKWLLPIGAFFVLLGFSAFFFKYYGGGSSGTVSTISSILYLLLEAIGLIGFFMLGIGMKAHPQIKKEYILYGLLGGLALYCVVVGLYNLIRYGFFYAAIYHNLVYYYQGVLYRVDTEAKALMGFAFNETTLSFACLPAFILASSGVGLLKMNPKQDRRKFLILLGLAGIGFLFLVLIPAWQQLVLLCFVYAFFGIYFLLRYLSGKNPAHLVYWKRAYMVLYILFIAVIIFIVFALITENRLHIIQKLFTALIGRVPMSVQTGIDAVYDCIYNGVVNADLHRVNIGSFLFGFNPSGDTITIHSTRFFEINILWQNGFLAFALLCFLICLYVKKGSEFLRNADKEDYSYRLAVVAMLLAIFVYQSLFADEMPLIHGSDFLPFTHENTMLLVAFLMGLIYETQTKKEVAVNE